MIPGLHVRVRRTDDKLVFAERLFSGFMGQTFIANWVLKVARAEDVGPTAFEYQIGKDNPWQT